MKKTLLVTAVLKQVDKFVRAEKEFTAADVTGELVKLRDRGKLKLKDVWQKYRTPNVFIGEILCELFDNGFLVFLERNKRNGQFFYRPTFRLNEALGFVDKPQKTPKRSLVKEIKGYLDSKKKTGVSPTLKNIQSRFKNDKLSLDKIHAIVTNKLSKQVSDYGKISRKGDCLVEF